MRFLLFAKTKQTFSSSNMSEATSSRRTKPTNDSTRIRTRDLSYVTVWIPILAGNIQVRWPLHHGIAQVQEFICCSWISNWHVANSGQRLRTLEYPLPIWCNNDNDNNNHKIITWFRWVSNPGPLACEASVITTTLRNPINHPFCKRNLFSSKSSKQTEKHCLHQL